MKTFYIIQKATGKKLDHGNFENLEAALIWWDSRIKKGHYGKPEVPEVQEVTETIMVDLENGFQEEQTIVVVPYQAAIPAEFEIIEAPESEMLEADKQKQIAEAKAFLASTDYQAIREFEGGKPMAIETKTARAEARVLINELE